MQGARQLFRLCLSTALFMVAAVTLPAANLLKNPGFEEGLEGWQIWGSEPADMTVRERSLSISADAASGKQAWNSTVSLDTA